MSHGVSGHCLFSSFSNMCKVTYNNIFQKYGIAWNNIHKKKHKVSTEEYYYFIKFQVYLKSNYKYNRNKAKLIFDTVAEIWHIFLTTILNKSNTWKENALRDLVENCYEKRYFIQFAILILY